MDKITTKIKIWGIVQGVGFRPFAAKLADRLSIRGEVLNTGGLVEIIITDTEERIDAFIEALRREKPTPAEIIHIEKEYCDIRDFERFTIAESVDKYSDGDGEGETAMIPADLSICSSCIREMNDETNRRYQHPFISCMECGPRVTIIDRIPYDRQNTSMHPFEMCNFCRGQYEDRTDRRYHAQTISCHECGPVISYKHYDGGDVNAASQYMIRLASQLITEGKLIAVKGVGGYHLMCDPFYDQAVADLRKVKGREQKPFAVLFLDIEQAEKYCEINETEKKLLESSTNPILLLERKTQENDLYPSEFEKSRFIGAFLPGTGIQSLILQQCTKPLIATSANVSGLPMVKDDEEMFALASKSDGLIAGTFYNKREIKAAVEDSVVRVIDGKPQMIRRSKGYTPVPLYIRAYGQALDKSVMMLACGGQLKSAFALSKGAFSYVSQHFGDLDHLENMRVYEETAERMKTFFGINPGTIICDMHPLYETTKYAEKYAGENGIELIKVQHHHAHVASVMAEHDLAGPVIGVSFDGTGYGTDGNIWGGEFLICEGSSFKRDAHLKYITMPGGDASMKDAWKSAISYAYDYDRNNDNRNVNDRKITSGDVNACTEISIDISEIIAESDIRKNENWGMVTSAIEQRMNTIETSSMGRLFDAVSSLLGICHVNRYEGECAILLEDAAARAIKQPGNRKDDLALKFHRQVADMIFAQCVIIREKESINKVALTGGVFQNKILMEETLKQLRSEGFEVYYNISVSPNDGGICVGQNYIGMCLQRRAISPE